VHKIVKIDSSVAQMNNYSDCDSQLIQGFLQNLKSESTSKRTRNQASHKNAWLRNTTFSICNWSGVVKFWFWFLWSIDAVIAAVVLYFFFSLAAHSRIGSFNILPWLIILAVLATVLGGGVWLRSTGQRALAIALILLLAIPGTL